MTTSDVKNILCRDAMLLGIDVYPSDNVPIGANGERAIVFADKFTSQKIWNKCPSMVNIMVPDLDDIGNANLIRLEELENMCMELFKDSTDEYGGETYTYSYDSIGIKGEEGSHSHYISIRLTFQTLNVGL